MDVTQTAIRLNSPNPSRLRAFYREVLGLRTAPELGDGMFRLGADSFLDIDAHEGVRGPADEPQRRVIELGVADTAGQRRRIAARGVRFVREDETEAWAGAVCTLVDPDGNYVRLTQW